MLDGVKDDDGNVVSEIDASTDVGEVVKEVRKIIRDEKAAEHRRRVQVEKAELEISELKNGESTRSGPRQWHGPYETLRRLGFKDPELQNMTLEIAGREAQRWVARSKSKPRLCSHGQWKLLQARGHKFDALQVMTAADASKAIEKIAIAERWKPRGAA